MYMYVCMHVLRMYVCRSGVCVCGISLKQWESAVAPVCADCGEAKN